MANILNQLVQFRLFVKHLALSLKFHGLNLKVLVLFINKMTFFERKNLLFNFFVTIFSDLGVHFGISSGINSQLLHFAVTISIKSTFVGLFPTFLESAHC